MCVDEKIRKSLSKIDSWKKHKHDYWFFKKNAMNAEEKNNKIILLNT